ncbi:hypothetical protein [Saccharopolyspora sp. CA-218241]|uniref:hypothetical protein n=1 Tax=Saccharopolyspora sp. CA-218241 TaxID=3240027 RepID=UPI003D95FED1
MAGDLEQSTEALGEARPLPPADAGPSSAAVSATAADLLRAAAGYVEVAHRGAADLDANSADYASTDDANSGLFQRMGH